MAEGSKAVDFGYLETFASGDTNLVREVLKVFSEEAHVWAKDLATGPQEWRAIVHTMKGTGRAVGAGPLGDLCEKAELEGPHLLPQIAAELDEVIAEVDAWLAVNG